jgi:hypothetical protein
VWRAAEALVGYPHTEACERPRQLLLCGRGARYHPKRTPVRSTCASCGAMPCVEHTATWPRSACFQMCWQPAA